VLDTIAHALRVSEASGQPLIDLLKAALGDRALLLLLDNFEHVLDSAPLIADLLATCLHLKILVTSRAALHIRAEHQSPVAPLALPDPADFADVHIVAQTPAVALFVARAQAARPSFTLGSENVAQVAEICIRLDGLPLAIELITARLATLSPADLLQRLDHRLDMLTDGPRDLPAHQQTLRAAIAWSYQLLDPDAQALFRRLSVFVGGWTLEAAVAVCADAGASGSDESTIAAHTSIVDGLTALYDQSLLRQTAETKTEPRWTMLETVREYALERLVESGEAQAIQERHAHFFLRLAEAAEPQHEGPQQAAWLDQLETEHDNLRAALRWALDHGVVEVGLRLVGTLGWLWFRHSHLHEGYQWARAVLDMPGASDRTAARAKALWSAGILAWYQHHRWATTGSTHVALARFLLTESVAIWQERGDKRGRAYAQTFLGMVTRSQGDLGRARSFEMESVALFREVGDRWGLALALLSFANVALWQGDLEAARQAFEESLALSRAMADKWNLAVALGGVSHVCYSQVDYATARSLYEEALTILRDVGDRILIGEALSSVGQVARSQGDYERAAAVAEEQLALSRELGNKQGIATSLRGLGCAAHGQGDHCRAAAFFAESLALFQELGDAEGSAWCLAGLAGVMGLQGQPERAGRWLSAAGALLDATGAVVWPADRTDYDRNVAAVRAQLDDATFAAAWAAGLAIPLEQAINEVLNATSPALAHSHPPTTIP